MSAFSIYTRVSIEIYAKFPADTTDFESVYDNLPPFLHKGLVVEKGKEPEVWTVPDSVGLDRLSVASLLTIRRGAVIYTAHELLVSNSVEDEDSYPCLESAPIVLEAMPSLFAGVTDTQSISFTLLDPDLKVYFSSDFTTTNSLVQIFRVGFSADRMDKVVSPVWIGYITNVDQSKVETAITARNEMKKMDHKATFGFLDEIPKWRVNEYKVPIISAVMIPYTVQVERHTPQLVSYYENWRRDYYLLATGRNVLETTSDIGATRREKLDITFKPFFGNDDFLLHPEKPDSVHLIDDQYNIARADTVTGFCHVEDIFFLATYRGFIYVFNEFGEPYNNNLHATAQNPFWANGRFVGTFFGFELSPSDYISGLTTDGRDLFISMKSFTPGTTVEFTSTYVHTIPVGFFTTPRRSVSFPPVEADYIDASDYLGSINEARYRLPKTEVNEGTVAIGDVEVDTDTVAGVQTVNDFDSMSMHYAHNLLYVFEKDDDTYGSLRYTYNSASVFDVDIIDPVDRVYETFEIDTPQMPLSSAMYSTQFYSTDMFAALGESIPSNPTYDLLGYTAYYHPFYKAPYSLVSVVAESTSLTVPAGVQTRIRTALLSGRVPYSTRTGSFLHTSLDALPEIYYLDPTQTYPRSGIPNVPNFNTSIVGLTPISPSPIATTRVSDSRVTRLALEDLQHVFHVQKTDAFKKALRSVTAPISSGLISSEEFFSTIVMSHFEVRNSTNFSTIRNRPYISTHLLRKSIYRDLYDVGQDSITALAVHYPTTLVGPVVWVLRRGGRGRNDASLRCYRYVVANTLLSTHYFSDVPTTGATEGFVEYTLHQIALPTRVRIKDWEGDRETKIVNVFEYTDIDITVNQIYVMGKYEDRGKIYNFVRRYRCPYDVAMPSTQVPKNQFADIATISNVTLIALNPAGYLSFFDLQRFKKDNRFVKNRLDVTLEDITQLGTLISLAHRDGLIYILGFVNGKNEIRVYTLDGKRRQYLDFSLHGEPNDPFNRDYRNNVSDVSGIDIADNNLYVSRGNGAVTNLADAQKYDPYIGVWELPEFDKNAQVDLLSLSTSNVFEGIVSVGNYHYVLNTVVNSVTAIETLTGNPTVGMIDTGRSFVFEVDSGETAHGIALVNNLFYIVVNRYISLTNVFTGYIRVYNAAGVRQKDKEFKLDSSAEYTGLSNVNVTATRILGNYTQNPGDYLYILDGVGNRVQAWTIGGNREFDGDLSLPELTNGKTYQGLGIYGDFAYVLVADPMGNKDSVYSYALASTRGVALPVGTPLVIGGAVDTDRPDLPEAQRIYRGLSFHPYTLPSGPVVFLVAVALGADEINIDTWFNTSSAIDGNPSTFQRVGGVGDLQVSLMDTRNFSGITAGIGLGADQAAKQTTKSVNFFVLDSYDNTVKFYLSRRGTLSNLINLGTGHWAGITTDDAVSFSKLRISKDGYIYCLRNGTATSVSGMTTRYEPDSVQVYNLVGDHLPERSFEIIEGGWTGITVESLGVDLYLLDNDANRIVAYNIDGRRNFLKDFDLHAADWTGAATDGLYIYTLDNSSNNIAVWSLTGKRRRKFDRRLPAKQWTGITTDNTYLYVVNNTDKVIFQESVSERFAYFNKEDIEDSIETGQGILSNYVNNSLTPNYISFDKSTLPRSFIQMEESGRLTFNRGIFILPSEEDEPILPGTELSPMALHCENFRLSLAPAEALTSVVNLFGHFFFQRTDTFESTLEIGSGAHSDFDIFREGLSWVVLDKTNNRLIINKFAGIAGDRVVVNLGSGDYTSLAANDDTNDFIYVLNNDSNKVEFYNTSGTRQSAMDISLGTGDWQKLAFALGAFFVYDKTESKVKAWSTTLTAIKRNTDGDINIVGFPRLPDLDEKEFIGMTTDGRYLFLLYDITVELAAYAAIPDGPPANSGKRMVAAYSFSVGGVNSPVPETLSYSDFDLVSFRYVYTMTNTGYFVGMTSTGKLYTYRLVAGTDRTMPFYGRRPSPFVNTGPLYDGIGEEPFTVNIGTSFTRWATLGLSRGVATPIDRLENDFVVNYSDSYTGELAERPPHPLDPLYMFDIKEGELSFLWFNYHNIHKFFRVRRNPLDYFLDFWATYLLHGRPDRCNFPTVGIRSKDMYSTESTFKDFQGINPNRSHALYDYTLDGNVTPNPVYDGSASSMLRMMPALREFHIAELSEEKKVFPKIVYKNSPYKGGAYYVSARYDQPDVMYYDTSIIENDAAYSGYVRSEYFNGFYHHDMYDSNTQHLRPSTFIYACLKNARLVPAFKQDGSDVYGDLNEHRMQLIANTDVTYKDLVTRVLPALGYLLRMNGETREVELIDLFLSREPKFTFNNRMIQFVNVVYDSAQQYSSYIYENEDMLKGDNTLDEFRESSEEQGRQVVFNSNTFINGKTLEIKTGTWTTAYRTVSTYLSKRQDRYQIVTSNAVLMEETGRLNVPAVGDWVCVESDLIPGRNKSIIVLIISKSMAEGTTEYSAIHFEDDTGETE